jgi:hypothetical protein
VTETVSGCVGKLRSEGAQHDRGACIGGKQGPMDVCPFDELNDVMTKMPLCELLFVTLSVGALRSLCPEGSIYRRSGWLVIHLVV